MSDNFTIGDYVIDNLVPFARGAFGKVYHCRKKGHGKNIKYVAKEVKYASDTNDIIVAEETIAHQLDDINCKSVLKYEDCIAKNRTAMYFITRYCNRGTLDVFVEKNTYLKIAEVKKIFGDVADAIKAIHEKNIIHRDLKPANIFLDVHKKQLEGFLADFGFSTKKLESSTILGTPVTMAPEILRTEVSNNSVDIWAFGICLYNACFGTFPFMGIIESSIKKKVYKIPHHFILCRECIELIEACLQYDSVHRIKAADMAKHPFFTKAYNELEQCFNQTDLVLDIDKKIFTNKYDEWVKNGTVNIICKK